MNRTGRQIVAVATILVGAVALPARGQNVNNYEQLPRPLMYLMLLREPAVQQELGLAPAELDAVSRWNREEIDGPLLAMRNRSPQQIGQQSRELADATRERLSDVLQDDQRRRLEQIMLRVRGIRGLLDPPAATELNLAAQQREEIEKIVKVASEAINELRQQVQRGEAPEDVDATAREIREQEQRDILSHLDDAQQQKLRTIVGPPFDLAQLNRVSFRAPEIAGAEQWLNSRPLNWADLEGEVVALHFWAFSCINCQRNFRWYRGWQKDFSDRNFRIIGVHTPELPLERELAQLEEAVAEAKFQFPVLVDNSHQVWNSWGNSMWPAVYLIDKKGRIRYWWYGELNWQGAQGEPIMRKRIEELLAEETH